MKRISLLLLLVLVGCDECAGGDFTNLTAAWEITPETVDAGVIYGGQSGTRLVTVRNTGEVLLEFAPFSIEDAQGPAMAVASTPTVRLPAGDTLAVEVRFTAQMGSTGLYTGTLVLQPAGEDAKTVALSAQVLPLPPCDDNNPCTLDTFDGQDCVYTPLIDNTPCDDGNACTYNTVCVESRCVGQVLECQDTQDCTVDRCDPAVGCVFDPVDGLCNDDDGCTIDTCSSTFGCVNEPAPTGTVCHFNGCVDIGFCVLGTCQIQPTPNDVPCEDGDPCTLGDTCQEGACTSGEEGDIGAFDPLTTAEGTFSVDLCFGDDFSCGSPVFAHPDEILATGVLTDGRSRVVWRSGFVDDTGALCVPEYVAQLPFLQPIDPDNGRPNEDRVAEPPPLPPPPCGAGLFLTDTDPLTGASGTVQIGVTRGAAAASLGRPFDPVLETEILLARMTEDSGSLHIDRIDTALGTVVQDQRTLPTEDLARPNAAQAVAIHTDGTTTAVAALSRYHRTSNPCPGCDGCACGADDAVPLKTWTITEDNGVEQRNIGLVDAPPELSCGNGLGVDLHSQPVRARELTVRGTAGASFVSVSMVPNACAGLVTDADYGVYAGFGPGTVDDAILLAPATMLLDDEFSPAGTAILAPTAVDTMLAPYVAGVVEVQFESCADEPCPMQHVVASGSLAEPTGGEVSPTLTFDRTFFAAGQTLNAPEAHPFPLGEHELVVARLGQSVQLIGTNANTDQEVTVLAPSLYNGGMWTLGQPMKNGAGQIAGLASKVVSQDDGDCACDPIPEPPDGGGGPAECACDPIFVEVPHIVVQRFGCLAPAAVTPDSCLEHSQCGQDEGCRLTPDVCLPPPGCGPDNAEEPQCQGCAGECVEISPCTAPDVDGGSLGCGAEPDTDIPLCPTNSLPSWLADGQCGWTCVDALCAEVVFPPDAGVGDAGLSDGGTDGGLLDSGPPPDAGGAFDAGLPDGGAASDAGPSGDAG